jgi:dTDP-4-dehydrorhamnose 3,5-epimerase-like enzyme
MVTEAGMEPQRTTRLVVADMELRRVATKGKDGAPNGWIVPIFRDYDELFKGYTVRFVYMSAVAPHTSKGPHVHHKRQGMLVPVVGRVTVTRRVGGVYETCELDADSPGVCHIPTHVAFKVANETDCEAVLLNLADHAWRQDDQDAPPVEGWEE